MASEAISGNLISKKFPKGVCRQTPLVFHAYAYIIHAHIHITPLLKILATGLIMPAFSACISWKSFCYGQVHSPRMLQSKLNTGGILQSYVNHTYSNSLRKNHLLCTVIQPPWFNVNAGASEASSKWVIKRIAQIVLWQQLWRTFGSAQLLVLTTINF